MAKSVRYYTQPNTWKANNDETGVNYLKTFTKMEESDMFIHEDYRLIERKRERQIDR